MTTRYEPAIDVDALKAIDVHVHIEIDEHGHSSLPDDLAEAASKYFRTDGPRPDLDSIQRRLGDIDVPDLDQWSEMTEHERQQQGLDVGTVYIGVCEQDDLVIARLLDVEVVADPGPHRGEDVLDFGVLKSLCQPGLLDVEDLSPNRENRLRL